ncbi:MAG: hypothetical protein KME47_09405 [Nodosilinea sp. WJT8-NPBG4]|jgi:hypothetical protein|nr:hypothetical protein [Nodosilinea sp. WJT8-NPBG4]
MGSPFKKFTNLWLTYSTDSGQYETDSLGIQRPVNPVEKTVTASVYQGTLNPSETFNDGPAVSRMYVTGNLVEPKLQPTDLPLNQLIKAKFVDPASGVTYTGDFSIEVLVPQRFKAVSKALGTQISGYFLTVGGG